MKRYTTDLIRTLAATHHRSQAHYRSALREITAAIADALAHGHAVQLTDFGTFSTHLRPPARIRAIRSGKHITVPAHHRVIFRPGERLKGAVRARKKPNGFAQPQIRRILGITKRARSRS